jgi:hypothetical protein
LKVNFANVESGGANPYSILNHDELSLIIATPNSVNIPLGLPMGQSDFASGDASGCTIWISENHNLLGSADASNTNIYKLPLSNLAVPILAVDTVDDRVKYISLTSRSGLPLIEVWPSRKKQSQLRFTIYDEKLATAINDGLAKAINLCQE